MHFLAIYNMQTFKIFYPSDTIMIALMATLKLVNFYLIIFNNTSLKSYFKPWYMEYLHNYYLDLLLYYHHMCVSLLRMNSYEDDTWKQIVDSYPYTKDRHIKLSEIKVLIRDFSIVANTIKTFKVAFLLLSYQKLDFVHVHSDHLPLISSFLDHKI